MNEMNKDMHEEMHCLRIGMKAPDFTAVTTFGPIKFSQLKGKWVVFFSHPGDFTPVCTTEFIAFAQCAPEFASRGESYLDLALIVIRLIWHGCIISIKTQV